MEQGTNKHLEGPHQEAIRVVVVVVGMEWITKQTVDESIDLMINSPGEVVDKCGGRQSGCGQGQARCSLV